MDIEDLKGYLNEAIEEINKGQSIDEDQNHRISRLEKENKELKLALLLVTRLLANKGAITQSDLMAIESAMDKV